MNHQHQVLAYLQQGKSLTQAQAIKLFNCYRLSAVVNRLRKLGYSVITHKEANTKNKGSHARYELNVEAMA